MKNVASDEAQFNAQKEQMQDEAQMGETAAKIAAKAPVSPETVIKTIEVGRTVRECQFLPLLWDWKCAKDANFGCC